MARNERFIAASPEQIWRVLADADNYGYWVVGSKEIRDAEPDWPRPGSKFHHTVGFGPFTVRDHTRSIEAEEPRLLKMRAKARPLGTANVTLELHPEGNGTKVVMVEDPGDAVTAFVFNPLTHLLVRGRNVESLDRLAELSERQRPGAASRAAPATTKG